MSDRWYFGGLLWVPGEHPAESVLEAVGLRDAIPVGYRTREEITSRSFGANERLRAIFREAGWTFMLEPRGRRQSFRTLAPLSKRFGEAHAIAIDDINDIGEAASAKDGAITGSAQVEGGECELEGEPPRIELDAERSRDCVVGLLKKTTGLTLDQLVYFGTHEWAGSASDASIAAVLDHEPVGEVFATKTSDESDKDSSRTRSVRTRRGDPTAASPRRGEVLEKTSQEETFRHTKPSILPEAS